MHIYPNSLTSVVRTQMFHFHKDFSGFLVDSPFMVCFDAYYK